MSKRRGCLTPLAVEYRYPGLFVEPESEEFREAFAAARALYDFILGLLPPQTHP